MTDELLKALQLIKDECSERNDTIRYGGQKVYKACTYCPLGDANGECGLMTDEPRNWSLKKKEVYF